MKILIAEDDAVSRTILRRSIEKAGHDVLVANDGEQAWALYEANTDLNVIVSDWIMPNLDGLGLCHRVRNEEREPYTYFVFLTALGDREHLLAAIEAGADDYLSKPLDTSELQMRLMSAHRVTTLHRQLAATRRQLQELNETLFEQSRQDPMTHLGNRLKLLEDLEALCAGAGSHDHYYAAILFDIDHFKAYNDTFGHQAGDEALKSIARVLKSQLRNSDTVYRYGGEEFLVILPEQSLTAAVEVAGRIRRDVEALRVPNDSGIITISAGVAALSASDCGTPDELLRHADKALYEAKKAGRNRVIAAGRAS